jgi:two-component system, sensor histidine kinase
VTETAWKRVDAERIAAFYTQAPAASATNGLLAVIVTAVMYGHVADGVLATWFVAVGISHVVRLSFWYGWRRDLRQDRNWQVWARNCTLSMLLSGIVWGVGGALMFRTDQPLLAAFWLILIAGIGAGVVAANAFHLPALNAYVVPLLLPFIVRIAAEASMEYLAIAFGLTLFLVFCLVQGRHQSRLLLDTLRMRHEKEALIGQLEREKADADEARRAAEESRAAKARLFAAASHDLRQPVLAISLFAANLELSPLPAVERQLVGRISQGTQVLNALFDDLLEISRLDAAAITPQRQSMALQELLDRLEMLFAPLAMDAATRLYIAPKAARIDGDPVLLARIVGNLVGNAVKYAAGGTVGVFSAFRRGELVVEVRDDGPGIPEDEHERIFGEFHQLEAPARSGQRGFGLGLATARRMARLMGGDIVVRSQPGCGSTFRLVVPA